MKRRDPHQELSVRRYAKERLRVLGAQLVAVGLDALFLAAWAAIQWGLHRIVERLELAGVDRWLLIAFQWLFGAVSLYLVLLFVWEDLVSVTVAARRRVRARLQGDSHEAGKNPGPPNQP